MRKHRRAAAATSAASILDGLFRRRVLLILGKGGVGRTRATALLASAAVSRGLRTLVMETDTRRPLAAAYGRDTSFAPIEVAPNLFAMLLDRQKSLEEYLSFSLARPMLKLVFASALYQYFVQAAPGLRELTMMGKIYNEIERRPAGSLYWDIIIVDMPASGQALNMLAMPGAAAETFARNLVGNEAGEVARFLSDDTKCASVIVSLAEPLAVAEAIEIDQRLTAVAMGTAGVICNRIIAANYGAAEVAMLEEHGQTRHLPQSELLVRLARCGLEQHEREHAVIEQLRRQIDAPLLRLPEAGSALLTGAFMD